MIFVTGANGHLGQLVLDALLARVPASQLVAGVRSLDKGAPLAARGVALRALDYNDPATIDAALEGVDKLLLISGSEIGQRVRQHSAVIEAARRASVKHLVYTSILHADRSKLILATEHRATEERIAASGIPFTFLRNGWYTENYTGNLAATIAAGALLGAAGEGRVAPAARADYAAAAAVVLTSEGHEGQRYELAGDRALTLAELAAEITAVSGKPVAYRDLSAAEYAATLQSFGLPEGFAKVLADSDEGVARGELADDGGALRRLIGRPTTPIAATLAAAL